MAVRSNNDIIKGDELWLFIGTKDSEAPIAFATSCSLNRSLSTNSVSSKDHGTSSYVTLGEGSWTASTEALYSVTQYSTLMDLFTTGEKVSVKFGTISNYSGEGIVDPSNHAIWAMSSDCWQGEGYFTSLQATGNHGDAATFSAEITGTGKITKVGSNNPSGGATGVAAG